MSRNATYARDAIAATAYAFIGCFLDSMAVEKSKQYLPKNVNDAIDNLLKVVNEESEKALNKQLADLRKQTEKN